MIKTFALLKFRFDLCGSFMSLVSLFLLSVSASPQIAAHFGVMPRTVVVLMFPVMLVIQYLCGWLLDLLKFNNHYRAIENDRNEMLKRAANIHSP